jgi:galactokinase
LFNSRAITLKNPEFQMKAEELISSFKSIYGESEEQINLYFGPGRVNLIGEHTDYNKGFVFPCALSFGTYLAIRKTSGPYLEFHSNGFDFSAKVPLQEKYSKSGNEWVNYPLGIIEIFRQYGNITGGLQFYYSGNIPPAAGLSSSASIEMVTAFAIKDLCSWNYSIPQLIHLSKRAENEFIGVNCGIMDMFSIGQGKEGHAIFLNCDTLDFELVLIDLEGYRLVITNTNKKRGLGESKYNERVEECAKAVEALAKVINIENLGDIDLSTFNKYQYLITDATILKRARHIVTEDARVLEAVKVLKNSDFKTFGRLMVESHNSLRDDYEVTGFELDSLVDIMLQQQGVLGARMTGAGFGGCTVAFVNNENVDEFLEKVAVAYKAKTGLQADFYLPEIGDGVKRLN